MSAMSCSLVLYLLLFWRIIVLLRHVPYVSRTTILEKNLEFFLATINFMLRVSMRGLHHGERFVLFANVMPELPIEIYQHRNQHHYFRLALLPFRQLLCHLSIHPSHLPQHCR
ncbi:hypothetical protein Leryth_024258 [Lithospermum erythrorhizon]|nr:hypothetical protein Leryth_024258 [Lithospermum erythrorhizon]